MIISIVLFGIMIELCEIKIEIRKKVSSDEQHKH